MFKMFLPDLYNEAVVNIVLLSSRIKNLHLLGNNNQNHGNAMSTAIICLYYCVLIDFMFFA